MDSKPLSLLATASILRRPPRLNLIDGDALTWERCGSRSSILECCSVLDRILTETVGTRDVESVNIYMQKPLCMCFFGGLSR